MSPYLLVSDTHAHSWTAFATTLPTGVNSRLQIILDAHFEGVAALKAAGGKRMFHAGDAFHVRGRVEPSVLNPTADTYKEIGLQGIERDAIPGNHDLEGADSRRVSNAITALEAVGVRVAHEPRLVELAPDWAVVQFPWFSSRDALLAAMKHWEQELDGRYRVLDAHIHAPVNGVLAHLPDHGFTPDELAAIGFTRVFSGHFHQHKDLGRGVYSIGALTHQTFGDIGSRAGYMLVYPDHVEQYETSAPKFVEVDGGETEVELAAKVKGNYVRVRMEITSDAEAGEIRSELNKLGAAGVTLQAVKTVTVTRSGGTTAATSSIEKSVSEFIAKKGYTAEVDRLCADILTEARVGE